MKNEFTQTKKSDYANMNVSWKRRFWNVKETGFLKKSPVNNSKVSTDLSGKKADLDLSMIDKNSREYKNRREPCVVCGKLVSWSNRNRHLRSSHPEYVAEKDDLDQTECTFFFYIIFVSFLLIVFVFHEVTEKSFLILDWYSRDWGEKKLHT